MTGLRRLIGAALFAAIVVSILAGCGSNDDEQTSSEVAETTTTAATSVAVAAASCNPARTSPTGMSENDFEFNGREIPYFVAVPSGYDGTSMVQLQIILPGASGQATTVAAGLEPNLVGAEAVVSIADISGANRDVQAIQALITTLTEDYCVDSRKVGLIGLSSSGPFTARLAEASEGLIAAMVVGIGSFDPPPDAERAVPLLAWTGNSDLRSADHSVTGWARVNGCDPEPTSTQIDEKATTITYQGCDAPIEYHVFADMGHQIPSHRCHGASFCYETPTFDLLASATEFVDANPLPLTD